MAAGQGYTTLELKVNYIRGMNDRTGLVRAEGKTIHVGGQTATAEGRLIDAQGRLLAHGTTTCLVFRQPARSAPPKSASTKNPAPSPQRCACV